MLLLIVLVLCASSGGDDKHYSLHQNSLVAELTVQKNTQQSNCICVPYWQCKEDFSGLVEDGSEIIDIRILQDEEEQLEEMHCTGDFDVCCQVECGRLNNGLSSRLSGKDMIGYRILEGNPDAEFGEFPWMLGLLQDKVYKCGASLIHPQVAITAAHCVAKSGAYKVRAGEWNWAKSDEPVAHQDRLTKKVIIHPHFHPPSLRNDIALLILDSAFTLNENVGVICVPPQGSSESTNNRCIASGWGKKSFKKGGYQSTLKKVELPLVPQAPCVDSLRRARLGPYFNLHRSFICAGGENKKDTCKGDGGSPLICPIRGHADRYEQVGIVSWGLTCGMQNTPGVYVNVALFSDWIDQQMTQHDFDTFIYRRF